jgi:hypothetical protein
MPRARQARWRPADPQLCCSTIYADATAYQWVDANHTQTFVWAVADRTYRFDVRAVRGALESTPFESVYVTPLASSFITPPVAPNPPVSPQSPISEQPPVHPPAPDSDGIYNDWLVGGKPVPAPAAPTVKTLTGTSVTIKLPTAPKGTSIAVYVRAAGGKFTKVTAKADKRGALTIKRLKRNTIYEVKLVKVKAGKQSAASKPLKVKTKKT